jgi:predicted secreted protein
MPFPRQGLCFLILLSLAAAVTDVPADATFKLGGADEQWLNTSVGSKFKVKLVDLRTTGFQWFLERLPENIRMVSNNSGGGEDEPPFILCELQALQSSAQGSFEVKWLYAKPWELQDPAANKRHITLHVQIAHEPLSAPVLADVGFESGGSEQVKDLRVAHGQTFTVKIKDLTSTGYHWYLEDLPEHIEMLRNSTGGGNDEPPFILCEMSVDAEFAGSATVTWLHVKPWEIRDPKAFRGHAKLRLSLATAILVV